VDAESFIGGSFFGGFSSLSAPIFPRFAARSFALELFGGLRWNASFQPGKRLYRA
jgi:hypothetical protein